MIEQIFVFGLGAIVGGLIVEKIRNRQLSRLSCTDHLTGLVNRRGAELAINALNSSLPGSRVSDSYCAVMVDIDNFKSINDNFGHNIGDKVIQYVATTLKNSCRDTDIVSRWGGEEFLIIMKNCDSANATKICEKIVTNVASGAVSAIKVTVSAGAVISNEKITSEVLTKADCLLYESKRSGKNKYSAEF